MSECDRCTGEIDLSSERYARLQETVTDPRQNREETYTQLLCFHCFVNHMDRDPTHSSEMLERARREGYIDEA